MVVAPDTWQQRFRAPTVGFPIWHGDRPERLVFISNEGGSTQVWMTYTDTGERRPLTNQRVGVEDVLLTADGAGAVWWCDDTGDESGQWVISDVDSGAVTPLLDSTLSPGWSQGISLAGSTLAVALADETDYRLFVSSRGGPARLVRQTTEPLGLGREWETTRGGLSSDGSLICYRNADLGDILHFGLRVIETDSQRVVDEIFDEGLTLKVADWSPVVGDQRLAIIHELDGIERPAVWDPNAGTRRNYGVDLAGPVDVLDWWPDGSALLLCHQWQGRSQLHRLVLADGRSERVCDPLGWISAAGVRPDGEIWLREESADRPPIVRSLSGEVVLSPPGPPARPGRPHRSVSFTGPSGESTHMLLTTPSGDPPFPVVMMVHGGPEWADPDDFDPWEQALVDHGFAVGRVNYRGSTGSGVAWRTAIHDGNIGFPEVADVVAGLEYLIEQEIADPRRAAIEGWSWGGYVALLAAGLRPELFAAVIGGIPVCDSIMTHEDCSPPQRAYDLAIMGGSPVQLPDRYRERSPSTYLPQVKAPVLLIAGEHDSACPIRQVRHYAAELERLGGQVDLHVYDAGHHTNAVEEKLRHAELELAFLDRHVLKSGK